MDQKIREEAAPYSPIPRGRTLSRTGKETASRILETAFEILRTEGYERFSLQGIAKRLRQERKPG